MAYSGTHYTPTEAPPFAQRGNTLNSLTIFKTNPRAAKHSPFGQKTDGQLADTRLKGRPQTTATGAGDGRLPSQDISTRGASTLVGSCQCRPKNGERQVGEGGEVGFPRLRVPSRRQSPHTARPLARNGNPPVPLFVHFLLHGSTTPTRPPPPPPAARSERQPTRRRRQRRC